MFKLRSWFTAAIAMLAFVLVSCSSSTNVAIPTTYSDEQIQQIQFYIPNFEEAKGRLADLSKEINEQDWQEVQAIMRGPFGETLQEMKYAARHLLPKDQEFAKETTRAVFDDFISIDAAAADKSVYDAQRGYDSAMRDFDQYLSILPEAAFDLPGDVEDEAIATEEA
ncbi:MAG: photosystem II protein PsbQ [Acaryochloridaceae cyanobacterium RL_2_7]|nr:photosystem II protein PsbQ [Acaryochloridaceae cyanobacterium RL_2_7]